MKIAVLTGGGDVPGLNAVIRAIVRTALLNGFEVLGIKDGWKGLIEGITMPLDYYSVENIIDKGGTILKSSRVNPYKVEQGVMSIKKNIHKLGIDVLIVIGGDDTLGAAYHLFQEGINVIGIPKTIDKDILGTDYTIGFDTATNTVCECIDKLRTTAESHSRAIIVEVMGRHSGWVALVGGMASGADYILIPERTFTITEIVESIERKKKMGQTSIIIVIAEGAKLGEDVYITQSDEKDQFGHELLGGIGKFLMREIKKKAHIDTRYVSLGHIQRGGSPSAYDRVYGTRLGVNAVDLIKEGKFGKMLAIKGINIGVIDLSEIVGKTHLVSEELYKLARVFF